MYRQLGISVMPEAAFWRWFHIVTVGWMGLEPSLDNAGKWDGKGGIFCACMNFYARQLCLYGVVGADLCAACCCGTWPVAKAVFRAQVTIVSAFAMKRKNV